MPSVNSPGDGGYQYYNQSITDLENDLKAEAKRTREHAKEATDHLEARYQQSRLDHERQTEETIQNIRDNASESRERDRASSKAEVERVKAQTYDKFGRYNGMEADVLKEQLETQRRAAEQQEFKALRDQRIAEKGYENRSETQARAYQEQLEKTVAAARDAANETASRASEENAQAYNELRTENEKKYERLNQEHMEELAATRRETQRYLEDNRRELDRRVAAADKGKEIQSQKLAEAYNDRTESAQRAMNQSRAVEGEALRRQVSQVHDLESRYAKERGQGYQDAVAEYDTDWRVKFANAEVAHQRESARLRSDMSEQDQYFARLNDASLRDKDAYFTDVIARASLENHQERKQLEKVFNKDRDQWALQSKRDQEQARLHTENALTTAAREREKLLENQARSYQDSMSRQKQSQDETIDRLQNELTYRKTSNDPKAISPAAEAALRDSITGNYEKTLGAERDRHGKAIDSLQTEYAGRVKSANDEKDATVTAMHQRNTQETQLERSRFLNHIQETEYLRDEALRNKDYENQRGTDHLNRNYASTLNQQKRQFDESYNAAKNDADFRINSLRQQYDFEAKMKQREFNSAQSALIREYDQKAYEQKQSYEAVIADLKNQGQVLAREAERNTKKALEEQRQSYEQRIAQSEAQRKEREQYLTDNFNEQLERVKRSHALLAQKKG